MYGSEKVNDFKHAKAMTVFHFNKYHVLYFKYHSYNHRHLAARRSLRVNKTSYNGI